eukprot:TRINITY_DN7796_c0_g1_i1.p1 TRINITY_DN7796_c0_g1~~TRINITY_DN7796_c0_g1_i1.p1  ORF type:complete len:236 (-),score=89.14 TRINITY_DN7796_c0_g1_i1:102-809(-)
MNNLIKSGRELSLLNRTRLSNNKTSFKPRSYSEVGIKQKQSNGSKLEGKTDQNNQQHQNQERSLQHKRNNPGRFGLDRNHLGFPSFFDPFSSSVFANDPFFTRNPFFSNLERRFENPLIREAESQMNQVRVNLFSDKDGWVVEAELAGIPKEDVQVEIEDNVITIKGEKKLKDEEEDGKVYSRRESFHGSFSRSFELPDSADATKAKAKFQDGVLKIVIGKKEGAEEKVKKISIE